MSYEPAQRTPTGWVGWVIFASCILIVNGAFTIFQGLAGIFRDAVFFDGDQLLVFDLTAWGWIHLLLGILLVAVGVALYQASGLARVVAIIVVMVHLLGQFAWIGAYPWWSLIAITLDLLILYALIVHGDELRTDA